MPRILEMREIDGELWCRIGRLAASESGVALWSPAEQKKNSNDGYYMGYDDGAGGEPRNPE